MMLFIDLYSVLYLWGDSEIGRGKKPRGGRDAKKS